MSGHSFRSSGWGKKRLNLAPSVSRCSTTTMGQVLEGDGAERLLQGDLVALVHALGPSVTRP
jgi:hypothetical protein